MLMRVEGYIALVPRPDGKVGLIYNEKPPLRIFVISKEELTEVMLKFSKNDMLQAFITTERYGAMLPEISVVPSRVKVFLKKLESWEIK